MTVQAELQFVTDAARVASEAAAAVARLRSEIEALFSLSGRKLNIPGFPTGRGGTLPVAGPSGPTPDEHGRIRDSRGRFVKAGAGGADPGLVTPSGLSEAEHLRVQEAAHRHRMVELEKQGALEAARIRMKGEQDAAASAAKEQQRAANKSAELEQRAVAKTADTKQKSEAKIAEIRAKGEQQLAAIEAKRKATAERDARREQERAARASAKPQKVTEETTSGVQGAARAILEGQGLKGALGAFGGRGALVGAIADLTTRAASMVADLTVEFGKSVVAAQAYKEDITEAFTVVRRTAAAGESTMLRAAATADRLGASRAETAGQFLDLATKGFDDAKIEQIVGSLRDLTTIDPKASMEGLTKVIGKAQATGRLNVDILSELSTFGLEQADVIKEIGKVLGKTDAEVLKALSASGGIRGLGVDPILNAINAQVGGGPAGAKAAAKADRNLSSLLKRIEDLPGNILFDISAGPGLDSIKAGLKEVLAYFDVGSESGQRVRKVVGDLFNALAEGLFGVRPGDKEGVTGTLDRIVEIAEKGVPVVREAAETVGTLARALLALGSGDTSKLDSSTKRVVGVLNLVKELVLLLAPGGNFGPGGLIQPLLDILGIDADASEVRKWVDAVAGLLNPANLLRTIKASFTGGDPTLGNPILTGLRDMIAGASEELTTSASSLGSDIIDGMVSGITGGVQRVVDAAMSLGSSAISGVRNALDSHSPSREMIDVGRDGGEGLAIGYERSTSRVVGAAYDMADAGLRAATAQPFPLAMPTGLSSVPAANTGAAPLGPLAGVNITIAPNITIVGGANSSNEELANMVTQKLRELGPEIVTQILLRVAGG